MAPSQFIGEVLGTMILILLGNGVVANVLLTKSKGQNSGWIVITAGWAFAVVAGVFTAQATGSPNADLNPAVTIAKIVNGGTQLNDGIVRILGEFVGAFIGRYGAGGQIFARRGRRSGDDAAGNQPHSHAACRRAVHADERQNAALSVYG